MNADMLLNYFDRISEAPDAVARLRRFILDLAVRGKLVEQDANDEPAAELLKRIQSEKIRLIKTGEIRKEISLAEIETPPYEIPDSWTWTRLGNTGRIFNGNSVSEGEKVDLSKVKVGYPFIATKDVGYGLDKLAYANGITVPFDASGFKVAHTNTVLICAEGGSAGKKIGITDRDICFGNKLYANETWKGINPRYIFFLYQSSYFHLTFVAKMSGIIGGIARSEFVLLPSPIPPEEEQNRIVTKVDELMLLCDQLQTAQDVREKRRDQLVIASLHQIQNPGDLATIFLDQLPRLTTRAEHIKKLRQSILNLAVRGRLVTQNSADETATQLLERIQGNRCCEVDAQNIPFLCPVGWKWTTVQSLLDPLREISYGVIKLGDEPKVGGVPTLRCSDVRPGFIDLSGVRKVSETIESDYMRTRLSGGEVLINIRGTLGGVAKVPKEIQGFNVAREVAVIPVSSELDADFLVYVMLSSYFWSAIQENLRGIAYKGLNLGILRAFVMPIPPVAEQHRIVAKVNELMALCDQLEAQLTTTQTDSRRLLEAVLHEALAA